MSATKVEIRPELTGPAGRRVSWSLRDIWNYILQAASLGIFFGVGVGVSVVAPVLRLVLGAERSLVAGRAMVRGLFRSYTWWLETAGMFRIRFEGMEKLGSLEGAIVAPNHPGLLDAIFLIPFLPRPVCIMRAGLMRNLSFAGAAWLAGYIRNDRGAGMIRQCERKLRAGDNLLIFPEGTRTRLHARGVNPFKSGFALAAVLTGAPIQTVFIERTGAYLAKETSLGAVARVPICMTIRVGDVFHARTGESAKALAARLETYFRNHLENSGESVRIVE